MILLLRPFRPAALTQMPVSLRPFISVQQRLLHASPVTAVRKPTAVVVKTAASGPRKQHKKEQAPLPLATSSPTTLPPAAPPTKTPHAPPPTSKPPISPYVFSPHAAAAAAAAPAQPEQPRLAYQPGGDHAFLRDLAASLTPTVLYEATRTHYYIAWCFGAAGFLGLVSNMHFGHVSEDVARNMYATASVSLIAGLIWAACTVYICYGPVGLVKRISAVPHPDRARPTLLFEPVQFAFGKYPKPFEVKLSDVVVDRGFEAEIAKFNDAGPRRRRRSGPRATGGVFGFVRNVFRANVKLFTRATTFAQIRFPSVKEMWKVDLRDCKALEGGKTLDRLIQRDLAEPAFLTKMFRR